MLIAQWGLCVTWFPEIKYPREKVIQLIINFCVTTQQDFYFFMLRDWRERKQILKRLYPDILALFGFEFACASIIIEHLVPLLIRESMFYSLDILIRKMNLLQSTIWESTAPVTVCRNWTWHHAVCDMPVHACVWDAHNSYYFPIGLKTHAGAPLPGAARTASSAYHHDGQLNTARDLQVGRGIHPDDK